jgi:hypothetical protein
MNLGVNIFYKRDRTTAKPWSVVNRTEMQPLWEEGIGEETKNRQATFMKEI